FSLTETISFRESMFISVVAGFGYTVNPSALLNSSIPRLAHFTLASQPFSVTYESEINLIVIGPSSEVETNGPGISSQDNWFPPGNKGESSLFPIYMYIKS